MSFEGGWIRRSWSEAGRLRGYAVARPAFGGLAGAGTYLQLLVVVEEVYRG